MVVAIFASHHWGLRLTPCFTVVFELQNCPIITLYLVQCFSKTSTKILLKSCMTVKPDHEKLKLTNTIYICLNYIPKSYIKPEAHLVVIIISWSIIGWKNKNNLCTSELELGSHRTNYKYIRKAVFKKMSGLHCILKI